MLDKIDEDDDRTIEPCEELHDIKNHMIIKVP